MSGNRAFLADFGRRSPTKEGLLGQTTAFPVQRGPKMAQSRLVTVLGLFQSNPLATLFRDMVGSPKLKHRPTHPK